MTDLDRGIREAAIRFEPPEEWLERVRAQATRRHRNRRIVAAALGVGVSVIVILALALAFSGSDPVRPADRQPVIRPVPCDSGATTPPTGWWRAEGSGADAIGGRDATLMGDATIAPGFVGGAFTFDGDGDLAEVPDDPALNVGSDDFTVSLWVKFASLDGMQVLLQDWETTPDPRTSRGWTMVKLKGPGIALALADAGHVSARPPDLAVNTWHHVVGRRMGETVSVFVDGALVRSRTLHDPRLPLGSAGSLHFGYTGPQDPRAFFLRGQLDEIQLFVGQALPNKEIRSIYETQLACAT